MKVLDERPGTYADVSQCNTDIPQKRESMITDLRLSLHETYNNIYFAYLNVFWREKAETVARAHKRCIPGSNQVGRKAL